MARKKRKILKDSILSGIRAILNWVDRNKKLMLILGLVVVGLFIFRSISYRHHQNRVSQIESRYRQIESIFTQETLPSDSQRQIVQLFFKDYAPSYYVYKALFNWVNYLNTYGERVDLTLYQQVISRFNQASFYDAGLTLLLAYVYESHEQYKKAGEQFELFIEQYPQDHRLSLVLFDLARCKKYQSQFEVARSLYQRIIKDYPDSQWANRSKMQLVSLG